MEMHLIYNDTEYEEIRKFKRAISADSAYGVIEDILNFIDWHVKNKDGEIDNSVWEAFVYMKDNVADILEQHGFEVGLL